MSKFSDKETRGQGDACHCEERRGLGDATKQSPTLMEIDSPRELREARSHNTASAPVSGSSRRRMLVLGLGNPILGDDGVGWRVAEQCAERIKANPQLSSQISHIEVDCHAGGGLSLAERLIGYDQVILIDAIQTGRQPPGTVLDFTLEALTSPRSEHTSSAHDTSLATALGLGRSLGAHMPDQVVVVAIEAQTLYEFSEELSPAVETAVLQAVERVQDQLVDWTRSALSE